MEVVISIFLVGFVIITILLVYEGFSRRKTRTLVGKKQFRFRILIAVLFLAEVGLIFGGNTFLQGLNPLVQIIYWSGCLFLAFLLIVAAILDAREVLINYLVARRNLFVESSHDEKQD